MKKANFKKLEAGDLIEVPIQKTNGYKNTWKWRKAVVLKKGYGRKSGLPMVQAKVLMAEKPWSKYETEELNFLAEDCYEGTGIEWARREREELGATNREELVKALNEKYNTVGGCGWMVFLADNGFVFDKEAATA